MFLGCSPCCGPQCPDVLGFPNATGHFVTVRSRLQISAYELTNGLTFPAFDSGTLTQTLGNGESFTYGTQYSPSPFYPDTVFSLSTTNFGYNNYANLFFTFITEGVAFDRVTLEARLQPCYKPGAVPGDPEDFNSLFTRINIPSSAQNNNGIWSTPGRYARLSVHDGEVITTVNGDTNLYAIGNNRQLSYTAGGHLVGDRVRKSTLAGFPGSFPWRYLLGWQQNFTAVTPPVVSIVLDILALGATDDGAGGTLDMDYLHFGTDSGTLEFSTYSQ